MRFVVKASRLQPISRNEMTTMNDSDEPRTQSQREELDDTRPSTDAAVVAKRVVLLGDIHVYRFLVAPWRLLGKRLAGLANLWFQRRHLFDPTLLPAVVDRIDQIKPHLLVLSGDLTTTALKEEFDDVMKALHPLVSKYETIVVPGNHDRYTFASARHRTAERCVGKSMPHNFPHQLELTRRWTLLALDSAVPRYISSRGRVGQRQIESAEREIALMTQYLEEPMGLLILSHYPFATPTDVDWPWEHQLEDATELESLVMSAAHSLSQVVYLHGHVHRPWTWRPSGKDSGNVTLINAGAPCRVDEQYPAGQGFWQIDLPDDPNESVDLIHHVPAARDQWCQQEADQVSF